MLKLSIPFMERKWNIINLQYKSRQEDTPKKIKLIKELLNKKLDKKK